MSQPGGSDIGCWESGAKEAEERSANESVKNGLAAVGSSAGGNADQMVFINVRIFCYPILHLAVLKKAEQTPSIAYLIYAKSIGKQPPQFFYSRDAFQGENYSARIAALILFKCRRKNGERTFIVYFVLLL